jgi:hypothetical protein
VHRDVFHSSYLKSRGTGVPDHSACPILSITLYRFSTDQNWRDANILFLLFFSVCPRIFSKMSQTSYSQRIHNSGDATLGLIAPTNEKSAEEQRRTELTSRCCQFFAADFPRSKTPVDFR